MMVLPTVCTETPERPDAQCAYAELPRVLSLKLELVVDDMRMVVRSARQHAACVLNAVHAKVRAQGAHNVSGVVLDSCLLQNP